MSTVTLKSGGGSIKPQVVLKNVKKETAIGWLWLRFIADYGFRSALSEEDSERMFEATVKAVRQATYIHYDGNQGPFESVKVDSKEDYESGPAAGKPLCSIIVERGDENS